MSPDYDRSVVLFRGACLCVSLLSCSVTTAHDMHTSHTNHNHGYTVCDQGLPSRILIPMLDYNTVSED